MLQQIKNYNLRYLANDVFAGIIIAAMSIPISIGYTQVAGLPAVYGLYGSVFPVLVFALLTSSPQMVFGVDAAPAALVGGLIATLGIKPFSKEAMTFIPVITFCTACWLVLFYFLKAGKLVDFISTPVMGGFITGIAATIILMQIPKLMGSPSGSGELLELAKEIYHALGKIHGLSLALGIGTLLIIEASKRLIPKFPIAIVMMGVGAILTKIFDLGKYGVVMLSKVESGLPSFALPNPNGIDIKQGLGMSLTIAIVIMAETLLSSNNFAMKNGYRLDDNREILAYSAANFVGALNGSIPLNGSVSRTVMAEQYGSKTQVMSIASALTMMGILLFGTGFIQYLPVPILTAIIMSALISVLEIHLAVKLYKVNKAEFWIFMAAFFGVLLFGTLYGVLIGGILSFVAVIIRAVEPPTGFLGVIPGEEGFYELDRNRKAREIQNTVIYRFGGNLFFANIKRFKEDIEGAIKEGTKQVIVDASGISNIDVTAAERLEILHKDLKEKGIKFYLTEHVGTVNDQLRALGMEDLIEEGVVRRTITLALKNAGYHRPYPLEECNCCGEEECIERVDALQEFEWAFGKDAEKHMEQYAKEYMSHMKPNDPEMLRALREDDIKSAWGRLGLFDEDEFLEHLEMHIEDIAKLTGQDELAIEEAISERRRKNEEKLHALNAQALILLKAHRHQIERQLMSRHPAVYTRLKEKRREHIERIQKINPDAAKRWEEWYNWCEMDENQQK